MRGEGLTLHCNTESSLIYQWLWSKCHNIGRHIFNFRCVSLWVYGGKISVGELPISIGSDCCNVTRRHLFMILQVHVLSIVLSLSSSKFINSDGHPISPALLRNLNFVNRKMARFCTTRIIQSEQSFLCTKWRISNVSFKSAFFSNPNPF